jgi:four helix bundle protein
MRTTFRFEQLDVWVRAADLTLPMMEFADQLEGMKKFRFAEQLRSAVLSITNNIAEGAGSSSKREFAQFLNISRRSCFEVVNMLVVFERQNLCGGQDIGVWLDELEQISRMLEGLRRKIASQAASEC